MNSIIYISSDEDDFVDESYDISEEWVTELLESVDKDLREHDSLAVDDSFTPACLNRQSTSPNNPDEGLEEKDAMVVDDFSTMTCITKQGPSQKDSDDDCLILDGDPDKPVMVVDCQRNSEDGCDDLFIVGEKGDALQTGKPHVTGIIGIPNVSFSPVVRYSDNNSAKQCHCYVCDSPAPCNFWGNGLSNADHCHSSDKDPFWKAARNQFKKIITELTENLSPLRIPREICRPTLNLSSTHRICTTSRDQTLRRGPRCFRQPFNRGKWRPFRSQSFPRSQASQRTTPIPESFGNQMLRTASQRCHRTSITPQVHNCLAVTSQHTGYQSKQEDMPNMETFRDILARIEADLLDTDDAGATAVDVNMSPSFSAVGMQPVSVISASRHMNGYDAGFVSGKSNHQS
ncbi:hypothetical protein AXF42_Ash013247 [Apostasia shenzhenica]|uniref:Uncharacterized protein n=1 Tax=Apostasia shenzhenica TaxID=1088818 RepID=A0A2I0BBF9_9ASPA|nr:hypothetical protein AXF42_Ash013247 [Apostasia shenzhenica]